jgi:catechol 2,3-dioxygenase-like lactoylglutathione lyase family enzyme
MSSAAGTQVPEGFAAHFFQVAYVVSDLPSAEEWFKRTMGISAFHRMENMSFPPDSTYRGPPSTSSMHLSLAFAGEIQIELIQPNSGPSLYTDFLDSKGPGLHHVAFAFEESGFAPAVAALKAQGLETLIEGRFEAGTHFAYFDCEVPGASVIEILGFTPETWQFMRQMKQQSKVG